MRALDAAIVGATRAQGFPSLEILPAHTADLAFRVVFHAVVLYSTTYEEHHAYRGHDPSHSGQLPIPGIPHQCNAENGRNAVYDA